ncbi:MAG: metallophosphoesterase [Desulfobacterales bacterium]|nr:metallophosphoesterase [Desulfobacterales bacterium]
MQNGELELKNLLEQSINLVAKKWNYPTERWGISVNTITYKNSKNREEVRIIAGVDDDHIHVLSASGERIFKKNVNGRPNSIAIGDLTENGVNDIVVASYSNHIWAFSIEGEFLGKFDAKSNVQKVHVLDFYDSPIENIAAVTNNGTLYLLKGNGNPFTEVLQLLFKRSLIGLHHFRNNGQTSLVISEKEGSIYTYTYDSQNVNKETNEFCHIGKDVETISVLNLNDEPHLIFGSGHAAVFCYNLAGEEVWKYPIKSATGRIFKIIATEIKGDLGQKILVGSGDGYTYILNEKGKLEWKIHIGKRIRDFTILKNDNSGLDLIYALEDYNIKCYHLDPYAKLRESILKLSENNDFQRNASFFLSPEEYALYAGLVEIPQQEEQVIYHEVSYEEAENKYRKKNYIEALSNYIQLSNIQLSFQWKYECNDWVMCVYSEDINEDGYPEILFGTRDGYLIILDRNGELIREIQISSNDEIRVIQAIKDFNNETMIVIGTEGGHVIGYDQNFELLFDSQINRRIRDICLVINNEKEIEIFVAPSEKVIHRLLYNGSVALPYKTDSIITTITAYTDGEIKLIAGGESGDVFLVDKNIKPLKSFKHNARLKKIRSYTNPRNNETDIFVVGATPQPNFGDNLHVIDTNGKIRWTYCTEGWNLSVVADDVNNGDLYEVFVASGDQNLYALSSNGERFFKMPTRAWVRDVSISALNRQDITQKYLILGVEDHYVYCYRLLKKPEERFVHRRIDEIWKAILKDRNISSFKLVQDLINSEDPHLRGAAVLHCYESDACQIFSHFKKLCFGDLSDYVRTMCAKKLVNLFKDEDKQMELLEILLYDDALDVKIALAQELLTFNLSKDKFKNCVQYLLSKKHPLLFKELISVLVLQPQALLDDWRIGQINNILSHDSLMVLHEFANSIVKLGKTDLDTMTAWWSKIGFEKSEIIIHKENYEQLINFIKEFGNENITKLIDEFTVKTDEFKAPTVLNEGVQSASVGWLHLTDLHYGLKHQGWLWPNFRQIFYDDMEKLHKKSGPWDFILFTGDLVQTGNAEEYDKFTKEMERLFEHLSRLGSYPVLLPVPGNHDLVRPPSSSAVTVLSKFWHDDPETRESFWEDENGEYRQVIKKAFRNYVLWLTEWNENHPLPSHCTISWGLLPGDFSATITKNGFSVGIAGLNSAFLQLTDKDYESALDIHVRQLHHICDKDCSFWATKHDICFLITHHPPAWLHPEVFKHYTAEIASADRFLVHFCGHTHALNQETRGVGGYIRTPIWQEISLFGLEHFCDGKENRLQGYSAGRIEINKEGSELKRWPRHLHKTLSGDWEIAPFTEIGRLEDEVLVVPFRKRVVKG